jgi:hypothetical protein
MSAEPPPLDAFAVAAELFGDRPLTTGQLTQLRALDRRYWQRVYELLHPEGEAPRGAPRGALTAGERAGLRAMLVREVRAMATPAQRAELGWE